MALGPHYTVHSVMLEFSPGMSKYSSKAGTDRRAELSYPKPFFPSVGRMTCLALALGSQYAHAQQQIVASQPLRVASQSVQSRRLAQVFKSLLPQIKEKTKIPVLLPSDLPEPIGKAKYTLAGDLQAERYEVSLYYKLGIGDAGFAAFFSGQGDAKYRAEDMSNIKEVKLAQGTKGFFRPVSCGGSCAPANLWWMDGGVLYQIQLKLSSTMDERDQEQKIVIVANSAIVSGPR